MNRLNDEAIRLAAMESIRSLIGRPLREGETLISSGLIDSLSVLRLISDLEKRLTIRIHAGALQPDDFDDIDLIVGTVHRAARPLEN
jgi:acyl carrier protein